MRFLIVFSSIYFCFKKEQSEQNNKLALPSIFGENYKILTQNVVFFKLGKLLSYLH